MRAVRRPRPTRGSAGQHPRPGLLAPGPVGGQRMPLRRLCPVLPVEVQRCAPAVAVRLCLPRHSLPPGEGLGRRTRAPLHRACCLQRSTAHLPTEVGRYRHFA
eukprot:10066319-Alexandrium_andersonii.AAC.1